MTGEPNVRVPSGYVMVDDGNGGFEVVPSAEGMGRPVSFRLPPSERATLYSFIETFPSKQFGESMRWLLGHPTVRALIAERVAAGTVQRKGKSQ